LGSEGGNMTAKLESFWKEDLARYPRRPFLKEQSIWAIAIYRFGRWNDCRKRGPARWLCDRLYWFLFRIVETLTGVSFTKGVEIGPGLRVWHFGNIFIHDRARIGARCTLHQGVTIGNRYPGGPAPVVGDDVDLGAYSQVLGGVRVGNGAKIGAMSVVLEDVPDEATAVGVPARIIPLKRSPARSVKTAQRPDGVSWRKLSLPVFVFLPSVWTFVEMVG
jgi:serine O-acetyltransferase